jgi:hypothetical protein
MNSRGRIVGNLDTCRFLGNLDYFPVVLSEFGLDEAFALLARTETCLGFARLERDEYRQERIPIAKDFERHTLGK